MKPSLSTSTHKTAYDILLFLQEEALARFPAFPEAFGQLQFQPEPELSASLGTDGSSLFYNPTLVCSEFLQSPDILRRAYLHVHLHCLCFHIVKPKHIKTHLWDANCDAAAERLAKKLAPGLFDGSPCARDSHEHWFRSEVLTISDPFAADALKYGNAAENSNARGAGSDNSTKNPLDFETLRHLEELKRKWNLPRGKLENNVSQGTGKRGLASGSSAESAELVRRDSIDYHSFLRQFTVAREEAILDTDSFDYIPYYFGLTQYTNMPFIEPLEYREVNRLDELAIAIDTSGSCSGKIVRRFLEETWSILRQRENFFARMRLHLIQCDSMIQEHRIFTSVREWEEALPNLKILGQGNTDFRPVFECLDRMIEGKEIRHLRGLLYFTDGDGIFPRTAPAYDTAFVFLNHRLEKHKIPDWALRLNLNLPEEF